jgi:hypothetical protein
VSGVAICAAEIAAVSWLLLTNVVVRGEPSQTTTALLLKLPPFTVSENPSPPAAVLLGEIEVTEGVAGQPPQETTGNIIVNAAKIAAMFIADGVHIRQISGLEDSQGRDFERIISVAIQPVDRDRHDYIVAWPASSIYLALRAPFLASLARSGAFELPIERATSRVVRKGHRREVFRRSKPD